MFINMFKRCLIDVYKHVYKLVYNIWKIKIYMYMFTHNI